MKRATIIQIGLIGLLSLTSVAGQESTVSTSSFSKQQSKIKGLLIMELGAGNYAGKASQMNCTALPSPGVSKTQFNQVVGEDMSKALIEVVKHSTLKRGAIPSDHTIEFAFEDKYGDKDGPSAAVACALMLDTLRTGNEIDPNFAVTGDMNADGSVQPVGGVPDKIRGAANRSCTYVAVPINAEKSLSDALLMDGPKPFWEIQVFTIATFDDALALASTKKSAQLQEALTKFAEVQKVLTATPNPALLKNPKVQERLRAVLAAAPNCVSAKMMLAYGMDRMAKTLSLGGSLDQIGKAASTLMKHTKSPKPTGVEADMLATTLSELTRIRIKLDPRTIPFADSIKDFGTEFRNIKNRPPNSNSEAEKAINRLNQAAGRVDTEEDKIRSNKALMEELMR